MVALPKVELGEHPPVVGVGHQVLGHQRRKLRHPPERRFGLPDRFVEHIRHSPISHHWRHPVAVGHRGRLREIRLHPVALELPVSPVVHQVLKGVVHRLKFPGRRVVRPHALQSAADDALPLLGAKLAHRRPDFLVRAVRPSV